MRTIPSVPISDVYPNIGAVDGEADLTSIIGALLTVVLIVACLMLIISATAWALASSRGNIHAVAKARAGVFVSAGAAALAGCAVVWENFLIHLGSTL